VGRGMRRTVFIHPVPYEVRLYADRNEAEPLCSTLKFEKSSPCLSVPCASPRSSSAKTRHGLFWRYLTARGINLAKHSTIGKMRLL